MRLIDADALIEKAHHESKGMPSPYEDFGMLVEWIVDKTPTIEPQEWIPKSESGCIIECSSCGERMTVLGDENPNFCPYCGSYNGDKSDDIPIEYFENGGI